MQKKGIFKFYNRRGTIIIRQNLLHLGMLALLVAIYFILQFYVKSVEKDTQFEQIFLSRDVALLMNSLYSGIGDVEYNYSNDKLDLKNFQFEFKEVSTGNKPVVKVVKEGITKEYPYGKPI